MRKRKVVKGIKHLALVKLSLIDKYLQIKKYIYFEHNNDSYSFTLDKNWF